jgi:hypothetical protein
MKRYNVTTKKTYEKDGEEKTQWMNIGTLVHFPSTGEKDDSFILELSMFPHTKFFVFEQKKKEDKPAEEKGEVEGEQVAEEEIPF